MAEFSRSSVVSHIEARRSCQENSCYRLHTHDMFSIGYIESGTSILTGPADGPFRLTAGDAVVIPAGHVHACNPDAGRWEYQMMHVDQEWLARLTPSGDAFALDDAIRVLRGEHLRRAFNAASDAVFTDASGVSLESTFRNLARALSMTAAIHTARTIGPPAARHAISPVLDRLRDDEANPPMNELAASVGMDKFQLIREVKRVTGLAPLAWRQNARVLRGRQLLRDGESIASTAHQLGFADQSHFHRVFRQHVAASPGSYRNPTQERSRRDAP